MGVNNSGYAFQIALAEAEKVQQIDIQTNVAGSENPQTAAVAVKAMATNKGPLFIGFSNEITKTEKSFELAVGETVSIDIGTLGSTWFIGANAGDKLCILGVGP